MKSPLSRGIGSSGHPCDPMSRWRKFAFIRDDGAWWQDKVLRIIGDGPYKLTLNGSFRTVVEDFWLAKNETYAFDPEFDYELCGSPDDASDGSLWVQLEDGECIEAENSLVNITGYEADVEYILDLPDTLKPVDIDFTNGEDLVLEAGLNDPICDIIPAVPESGDNPIFGRLPNGTWLHFDPRLNLFSNTPESPLLDGGKAVEQMS